jgi:4-pyridoxate dehydrogenase
MAKIPKTYDYVIVGAGSAGCTLANRLTEDHDVRVLVLEAGGWDRHPFLKLPLGWGKVLLQRIYDWGYDSEPQDTMAGRRIEVARGKVVGGSSSINAMAYVRGNRADYDRWASRSLPDWSYANVLPYFRKQESWEGGGDNHYRGGSGPLATRKSRYQDPLVDAYLDAAQAAGYAFNDDYNGAQQDGFSRMQMTIRNGWRESAATAYLHPVLSRHNLSVTVNAHVTRVVLAGSRAVGVEYLKDGEKHLVEASREVILCGGSINSPQLLMLSGIGDADALRAHGIAASLDLPGVGKSLQDHVAALLIYGRCDESPLLRNMRLDRMALGLANGFVFGQGFATDLPGGITAFVKSEENEPIPDIQLLFWHPPICRRSSSRLPTVLLAASCCYSLKAAARSRFHQPIRSRIRAFPNPCSRQRTTGRNSVTASGSSAIWPAAVRSRRLSPRKSVRAPMSRLTRSLRHTRARPR